MSSLAGGVDAHLKSRAESSRSLALEQKVDLQFIWLVGIQLTTMLAVIGVLAAAYLR